MVPLDHLERVAGDVDLDARVPELGRQPARALEVELDLTDAVLDRDIEGRAGRGIDDPAGLEPVPRLESCHREPHALVEARLRRRAELSAGREARGKLRHPRPTRSRL